MNVQWQNIGDFHGISKMKYIGYGFHGISCLKMGDSMEFHNE